MSSALLTLPLVTEVQVIKSHNRTDSADGTTATVTTDWRIVYGMSDGNIPQIEVKTLYYYYVIVFLC
jgi:hypothetical protein